MVLTFLATIGFQSLLSGFHPFAPRMTMGGIKVRVDRVNLAQESMEAGSSLDIVVGRDVNRGPDHTKKRR